MRDTLWALFGALLISCAPAGGAPPAPAAPPPPASAAPSGEPLSSGLARVNYYRKLAGLAPLAEDPALSRGDFNHACYLVKNHLIPAGYILNGIIGTSMSRSESAQNPFYTPEGQAVAPNGAVFSGEAVPRDGRAAIDAWISMPFRSVVMLDPQMVAVGYGSYCEPAGECVAVLSQRLGLEKATRLRIYEGTESDRLWNPLNGPIPPTPGRLKSPIEFPPQGSTISVLSYDGGDWPDPLTSCPGYAEPTGIPVTLQLGLGSDSDGNIAVSEHSFLSDGKELEHCLLSATTYSNPDEGQQSAVRYLAHEFGALLLIPREPLGPGKSYTVSITADSKTYKWSFSSAPTSAAPASRVARAEISSGAGETAGAPRPWLERLNYYRAMVNLAPAKENPALNEADRKHARYLVVNYSRNLRNGTLGAAAHSENPARKGFTTAGSAAARQSNVFAAAKALDETNLIDYWMAGPFHRLELLSPSLRQTGYGSYGEAPAGWAAALYLEMAPNSRRLSEPILFPPGGATVSLRFEPGEWTDPLASCPGYAAPSGLPITLQFGWEATPAVSGHSLMLAGRPLEHCLFDGTTYTNPDKAVENWGRGVLRSFGAVVLIPREPLAPGNSYEVSVTAGSKTYAWSFRVAER